MYMRGTTKFKAIKICADFSSSGIWRGGKKDVSLGCMINYDELNLSKELQDEFHDWIMFYDEKCHDFNFKFTDDPVKIKKLNEWGMELAYKIAKLFPETLVSYVGEDEHGLYEEVVG